MMVTSQGATMLPRYWKKTVKPKEQAKLVMKRSRYRHVFRHFPFLDGKTKSQFKMKLKGPEMALEHIMENKVMSSHWLSKRSKDEGVEDIEQNEV